MLETLIKVNYGFNETMLNVLATIIRFLDSSSHLQIRPSVGSAFVKIEEKWTLRILNDFDSA